MAYDIGSVRHGFESYGEAHIFRGAGAWKTLEKSGAQWSVTFRVTNHWAPDFFFWSHVVWWCGRYILGVLTRGHNTTLFPGDVFATPQKFTNVVHHVESVNTSVT
jgi:hypothetical protein